MSAEAKRDRADPALWRAFSLHAVVAGAFGLLTIFWGEPSVDVMSVAGGLYFIGLAMSVHLTERSLLSQRAVPAWLTRTTPVFLAAVGVLNLWIHTDSMFARTGALALILLGVVYGIVWARNRSEYFAARDFLLVGLVALLTGALLPLFEALGAHALLGVAGGGAIITAVVLGLAALSYRHDDRHVSGPASRTGAVN